MTLPLNEVPCKEVLASKPGHIKDKYFRSQDINNAIEQCKQDISKATQDTISEKFLERNVFPFMEKWLRVK